MPVLMPVTRISISEEDKYLTWQEIVKAHTAFKRRGINVMLPWADVENKHKCKYSARALHLIALTFYKDQVVSKDAIENWTCVTSHKNLKNDQQVRHLKELGWDVRGLGSALPDGYTMYTLGAYPREVSTVVSGFYILASLDEPAPNYEDRQYHRSARHSSGTDRVAKATHCVTCGDKAGEPSRHNRLVMCKLQKGHKNPWLLDSPDNIIPQCQFCNRWASNNLIFGDNGRPNALASSKFVLRSPENVQFIVARDVLQLHPEYWMKLLPQAPPEIQEEMFLWLKSQRREPT